MSRQRKEKKARDKELFRQMGAVSTKEGVTQDLLKEKGRITELKWQPMQCILEKGSRFFWQKAMHMQVEVHLFLAERHRTRAVGELILAGALPKKAPGEIEFDLVKDHKFLKKISYARPAHFLAFAFVRPVPLNEIGTEIGNETTDFSVLHEGKPNAVEALPSSFLFDESEGQAALNESGSEALNTALEVKKGIDVQLQVGNEILAGQALRFSGIHRTKCSLSFTLYKQEMQSLWLFDVSV